MIVSKELAGLRLAKFLQRTSDIPYPAIQKLIRLGKIKINGKLVKTQEYRVSVDEEVIIFDRTLNSDSNVETQPKIRDMKQFLPIFIEIEKDIIFEDEHIIAINKKAGFAVQGGANIKCSMDDFLEYLTYRLPEKPKIVHRIDRDTSGVVVFAKNRSVAKELGNLFANRFITKTYLVEVSGDFTATHKKLTQTRSTEIKTLIKKDKYKAVCFEVSAQNALQNDDVQEACTIIKSAVYNRETNNTKLIVQPYTGRFHQIRAQLAFLGFPIVHDYKYGYKKHAADSLDGNENIRLQAMEIEFTLFEKHYKIGVAGV